MSLLVLGGATLLGGYALSLSRGKKSRFSSSAICRVEKDPANEVSRVEISRVEIFHFHPEWSERGSLEGLACDGDVIPPPSLHPSYLSAIFLFFFLGFFFFGAFSFGSGGSGGVY